MKVYDVSDFDSNRLVKWIFIFPEWKIHFRFFGIEEQGFEFFYQASHLLKKKITK